MSSTTKKLVFVVEDSRMFREMITDRLRNNDNITVEQFGTGEDCLNKMHNNPDIVILDYHLDSIQEDAKNGLEILKAIKKVAPAVEVVMFSSQASYGVAAQTIGKGACHYIIKDEKAYDELERVMNELVR